MNAECNINAVLDEIAHTLQYCAQNGCQGFDCTSESLNRLAAWGGSAPTPSENLAAIQQDLGDCRRCPLFKSRTNIVFGIGNPNAELVFVGEGPGYDEDQTGEPFVGAAGQLLTRIIKAINLTRPEVYICNIVKCRPPGNRNPESEEIDVCVPFVKRQINAVNPKYIVALGSVAARTLLEVEQPISRLRGRFYDFQQAKLLPTYHPAFLLRNPDKKRDVWEDMKKLIKAMDHES